MYDPPASMPSSTAASPVLTRALDGSVVLGERNSFIATTTVAPVTITNEWTAIDGLTAGPRAYDLTDADLMVAEDGSSIMCMRDGTYALQFNCQYETPTGDGWFEAAVEPVGPCNPLWPSDVNKGHVGQYVPTAIFAFDGVQPGYATTIVAPVAAGDAIIGTAKFSSASGLETVAVAAVVFAIRLGP